MPGLSLANPSVSMPGSAAVPSTAQPGLGSAHFCGPGSSACPAKQSTTAFTASVWKACYLSHSFIVFRVWRQSPRANESLPLRKSDRKAARNALCRPLAELGTGAEWPQKAQDGLFPLSPARLLSRAAYWLWRMFPPPSAPFQSPPLPTMVSNWGFFAGLGSLRRSNRWAGCRRGKSRTPTSGDSVTPFTPTLHTATPPAGAPSSRPRPASRAGSRICSGCASPSRGSSPARLRAGSSRWSRSSSLE